MKRSKRLLAMLLVTAMLCPALGIGAAAADTTEEAKTTLTVECPEKASPGQEITVTVKVENNDDLAAAKLVVDYDGTVLKLEKTEAENALVESSGDTTIWVSADENGLYQKQKATFTMVTYTFKVLDSAEDGDTPVTISQKDSEFTSYGTEGENDEDYVKVAITAAKLAVSSIVKGDVTGDGKVRMNDVVILARAAIGDVTLTDEQLAAGDLDGNGRITMAEVVKVVRFVMGEIDEL
jgi:hypothetical protein